MEYSSWTMQNQWQLVYDVNVFMRVMESTNVEGFMVFFFFMENIQNTDLGQMAMKKLGTIDFYSPAPICLYLKGLC